MNKGPLFVFDCYGHNSLKCAMVNNTYDYVHCRYPGNLDHPNMLRNLFNILSSFDGRGESTAITLAPEISKYNDRLRKKSLSSLHEQSFIPILDKYNCHV